jgi:RNA polymerase sigma factor (sigma-70 family)
MQLSFFNQQIVPVRNKLYRFALKITGNSFEAEDVVQEVMEKIWQSSEEQTDKVHNWEAWCMMLTRNKSIDKKRSSQNKRTENIEGVLHISSNNLNPAQNTESNDSVQFIRKIMQELPEKQRLVMHLRDIEDMAYEEIAETLEISLEQVKTNLHRARRYMREKLNNKEI